MDAARSEVDGSGGVPIIVRIAGLPATAVEPFAGDLPVWLARIDESERQQARARAELVERLHAAIQAAPPEQRRVLLALKRDSFNGRSLRRYHGRELPSKVGALATEVADLEERRERLEREFATAYSAQDERERVVLQRFLDAPDFLRGVALSSSLLIENLPRLRRRKPADADRRVKRLELSLVRYVSRAALKLSPFSRLTKVGLARPMETAGAQSLELVDPAGWSERSTLRLQRYIPEKIADLLARHPRFRAGLRISLNETLEQPGAAAYRFVRPGQWNCDAATSQLGYDKPALVRAQLSGPLLAWLRVRLGAGPEVYSRLLAELQAAFPSRRPDALREGLDRLVVIGILCCNPPWDAFDPSPESRLLEYLAGLPANGELAALAAALAQLIDLLAGYGSANSPGAVVAEGKRRVRRLLQQAAELAGVDPSFALEPSKEWFFQEDVFLQSELPSRAVAHLSPPAADELLTELAPLARLSNLCNSRFDFLHALGGFASNHWPDRGEIPFLDLFEAAYPLFQGFVKWEIEARPQGYLRAAMWNPLGLAAVDDLAACREAVIAGLPGCLRRDGDTVRLDRRALGRLLDEVPPPYAATRDFSAFLQPVDGGGPQRWVLNVFTAGTGRMSSRYTAAMDPELRARFTSCFLASSVLQDDDGPAELVDVLCSGGHTANIHAPQTRRVLIAPGHRAELPAERVLAPQDLVVRLLGPDRLPVLVDRGGRRLLPVHLGAVSFRHLPSLSKFVTLFGPSEMRFCKPQQATRREGEIEVIDRHSSGRLVYRRKTWSCDPAALSAAIARLSPARTFAVVDRWRRDRGIPDHVFLAEPQGTGGIQPYTKPQYVDFTSCLFVELFSAALKRGLPRLKLVEALPAPDEIPRCADGARVAVEIQLEGFGAPPDLWPTPFPRGEGNV